MPSYIVIEKEVGQTPLQAVEAYRSLHEAYQDVPMAYAGRLDPMASGKLMVLIGDECKKQDQYHSLDKEYQFGVLLGSSSDTGDVLGLVDWGHSTKLSETELEETARALQGPLSLPYPKFSSRTVKGKPLHIWTLENRLGEIEIPSADTHVYSLKLTGLRSVSTGDVYGEALRKINSLPTVAEESKALGRDFRRSEVRVAWEVWLTHHSDLEVQIATFCCIASSGTYMRSLAEEISRRLGTTGLAFSIHRSKIGSYRQLPFGFGFWKKKF